jgi:DNA-binding MarR family transcriptional regulator
MPTIEELIKTKPYKDPHQRAFVNIIYTGSWLVSRFNQMLKPYGITEPQYNVLRILKGQHGKAVNLFEIQERMVQRMSNVSRLIDKLLEKGYVSRTERKENRRMVDIAITNAGLKLIDDLEAPIEETFRKINSNLDNEEARLLSEWLDKLREE